MDFLAIIGIAVLAAALWLWVDGLKAREVAIRAAKLACATENLLLLDKQSLLVGYDSPSTKRYKKPATVIVDVIALK